MARGNTINNRPSKTHPWGVITFGRKDVAVGEAGTVIGWFRTRKAAAETVADTILGRTDDTGHPIGEFAIARWGTYYRDGHLRGC